MLCPHGYETESGSPWRTCVFCERDRLRADNAKLCEAIDVMLEAIEKNAIDSATIELPDRPPHKWHEEWAASARALTEKE